MKVYSPSEVALLLKIKTATLRKYSLLLEKHGYEIERSDKGHRYYRDKDVMTLRSVITGTNNGITLEESVKNVISLVGHNDDRYETNNDLLAYDSDIKELKEMMSKQNELIKGLTGRLDQQQKYIDESLKERDRLLMQSINEIMDNKKQLSAAAEEKKGLFARIFNK